MHKFNDIQIILDIYQNETKGDNINERFWNIQIDIQNKIYIIILRRIKSFSLDSNFHNFVAVWQVYMT